jgi:hypothetical protein
MRNRAMSRAVRALACGAVLSAVLAGPIAGASASDASIKSVIKSYDSKILVAEGHVVSALGEYKKSGDPSGVTSAITASVGVLRSLKSAIAGQSASSPKVKQGKAKFEKGLQKIIVGYQHLKTAFGEKKASPQAAKQQAAIALSSLKRAKKELNEGAKLLR